MENVIPNIIIAAIGLIICFFGIYFKRFFSAFIGLISSLTGSLILTVVFNWNDRFSPIFIIIATLSGTILSAIFYKAYFAVNSFILTFGIVLLIFLIKDGNLRDALPFILAAVLSLITSAISTKFYIIYFILSTAFIGGFIASYGFTGILKGSDVFQTMGYLMRFDSEYWTLIAVITSVLTIVGTIVQNYHHKTIEAKKASGEYKENQFISLIRSVSKSETALIVLSIIEMLFPSKYAIAVAALIYFVVKKKDEKYIATFIFLTSLFVNVVSIAILSLCWGVFLFVDNKVANESKKPRILLIAPVLVSIFLILTGSLGGLLFALLLIATTFILFKVRDQRNIFGKASPSLAVATATDVKNSEAATPAMTDSEAAASTTNTEENSTQTFIQSKDE